MLLEEIEQSIKNNTTNTIVYYDNNKRKSKTYKEVYNDIKKVVDHLNGKMGLQKGDNIGIVADNSYLWIVLDVASYLLGIVTVPFHKSDFNYSAINASIEKFELKYIFLDNVHEKEEVSSIPSVIDLSIINDIISDEKEVQLKKCEITDSETITIIPTSGTTSESKYIEINSKPFNDFMSYGVEMFGINSNDKIIVFIPLSHYGQRIYVYGALVFGFNLVLCDVSLIQLVMKKEKPTIIVAVPYLYELIYNTFINKISKKKILKAMFDFYLNYYDKIPKFLKNIYYKRIVCRFQDVFGGKMRIMVTGSAPISSELIEFYHKMELPLYEGYGSNETGIIALSYPNCYKKKSVGKLCPNKELRISEDNQLYVRGDACWAKEYYKAPKEECRKVFFDDGFIATGDSGYIDDDGFIFIDGRIKEWIVLNNGKKVNPIEIEKEFDQLPFIQNAIVYGDNMSYIIALFFGNNVNEKVLKSKIKEVNIGLPGYAKIKDYQIIQEKLSVENKMLNTSLKVIRKNIYKKYDGIIKQMYEK